MKTKAVILTSFVCLVVSQTFSQNGNSHGNASTDQDLLPFSEFIEYNENYFSALKSQGIDVSVLPEYKSFLRTFEAYKYTSDFPNFSIQDLANEEIEWIKATGGYSGCVINPEYPYLTFSEIGPDKHTEIGQDNLQGTGQVHYLQFINGPGNTLDQKMLACSGYGGMFYSDDAGQNWGNAGTDFGLPKSGVSSVAVSPIDPNNNWFLSTYR